MTDSNSTTQADAAASQDAPTVGADDDTDDKVKHLSIGHLTLYIRDGLNQIATYISNGTRERIRLARYIAEAKRRVISGQTDCLTWPKWCEENLDRSVSDVNKLLAVANSLDPVAKLLAQREAARLSMQKSRIKRAKEIQQAIAEGMAAAQARAEANRVAGKLDTGKSLPQIIAARKATAAPEVEADPVEAAPSWTKVVHTPVQRDAFKMVDNAVSVYMELTPAERLEFLKQIAIKDEASDIAAVIDWQRESLRMVA